jgi:hypothetical protein
MEYCWNLTERSSLKKNSDTLRGGYGGGIELTWRALFGPSGLLETVLERCFFAPARMSTLDAVEGSFNGGKSPPRGAAIEVASCPLLALSGLIAPQHRCLLSEAKRIFECQGTISEARP